MQKPFGGGLGGTHRIATEFLIFATKGRVSAKSTSRINWYEIKREYVDGKPVHSKKPKFFRELIERLHNGDKIELFAREVCEGWDFWGDEVGTKHLDL